MRRNLHAAVTEHPHWQSFEAEAAKLDRARARHGGSTARADAAKREHAARVRAYEEGVDQALLAGEEPRLDDPGEFAVAGVARGRAAQAFLARDEELERMTRSWAERKADELEDRVAAREAGLAAEAERAVAALEACVGEMAQLRDTLAWIRACAGRPQPLGLQPSVQNLLTARAEGFSLVWGIQERGARSLPMNLDEIDIGA